MADVTIVVGATPDVSFDNFRKDIKSLISDINKIDNKRINIQINSNVEKIKDDFSSLVKKVEELNKAKIDIKSNSAFTNTIQNGFTSMFAYVDSIKQVGTALEAIGKSANKANFEDIFAGALPVIDEIKTELASISEAISSFKGIDVSLNLGGSNPTARNAAYGKSARDTISNLKSQAAELEKVLMQYYGISDNYSAVMKAISGTNVLNGKDIFSIFNDIGDDKASLSKQMDAWKEYINIIKEAAKIHGIQGIDDISSSFSKSADQMINDTQKILSGEAELDAAASRLKNIFGSSINSEELTAQLSSINAALDNVVNAVNNIGGDSFSGLNESINKAVDGINRLVEIAEGLKDIKVTFDESGITSIKEQIQQLTDSLSHLKISADAGNGFKVIADDTKEISTNVEKANKNAAELTRRTSEYKKDSDKASRVTSTYVDPKTGTVTSISEVAKEDGDLEVSSTRITESFRTEEQAARDAAAAELELANVKKQIAQFNAEIELKQRSLANAGGTETEIYSSLENQRTRVGNLEDTYNEGGITAFKTAMTNLRAEFIASKSQADEFIAAEKRAASAAKQASQSTKAVTEETIKMRAARKQVTAESDNVYKSYAGIMKQLSNLPLNEQNTADLDALKTKYLEIQQAIEHIREAKDSTTQSDIDSAQKSISEMQELINTIKERIRLEEEAAAAAKEAENARGPATSEELDVRAAKRDLFVDNSNINKQYTSLKKDLSNLPESEQNTADLDALITKYLEVQKAIEAVKDAGNSVTKEQIENAQKEISGMQNLIKVVKERVEAEKEEQAASKQAAKNIISDEAAVKKYESTISKLQSALKKYSAARNSTNESSRKAYNNLKDEEKELEKLLDGYKNSTKTKDEFYAGIEKANNTLNKSTSEIKRNGDASQTLTDKFGNLATRFASWLSVSQVIMYAVGAMQNMIKTSIELDTAMTELKKVTDESDVTYDQFLVDAADRATQLGASLTDVVNSTADFARLGFNIKDASELADVATIYKNVGDGIENISDASESIIATMQAFGMSAEDAMSIVDKFNAVGNNYAISSKGVGEALLRSASAMKAANNTLDETIALTAAANTIVQDPEKVGMFDA